MSNLPNTLQLYPKIPFAACIDGLFKSSVSSTALEGNSTIEIIRARQHGAVIHQLNIKAKDITTAGLIRFFIRTEVGPAIETDTSFKYAWKEYPITAVTPSDTVASFELDKVLDPPLVLGEGQSLFVSVSQGVSTSNTDFSVCVFGGFY